MNMMQNSSDELFQNKQSGIYNKNFFFEAGNIIVQLAKRTQVPLLVALVDIDDFEILETTYGIATGEKVLELTTRIIIDKCRSSDLIAYIGEGKVGLIFYNITSVDATKTLESLRKVIIDHTYYINEEKKHLSVSIGGTIMHSRMNAGGINALYEQAAMAVETVRKKDNQKVIVY